MSAEKLQASITPSAKRPSPITPSKYEPRIWPTLLTYNPEDLTFLINHSRPRISVPSSIDLELLPNFSAIPNSVSEVRGEILLYRIDDKRGLCPIKEAIFLMHSSSKGDTVATFGCYRCVTEKWLARCLETMALEALGELDKIQANQPRLVT